MAIALYARKSVERENSVSCETQLEYCRAMLRPEERGDVILNFVDNGCSGGNTDRPGLREMMRLVDSGTVGKVIVYRLDRISRSLTDFVGILQTFKARGVRFVSSQETFDTGSPYGEMIVKMLMVFAEFERRSIIGRVRQAYVYRSQAGFYMGGRRPYGFSIGKSRLDGVPTKVYSPKDGEAEQVLRIFTAYAGRAVTLRRLADEMNDISPLSVGKWTAAKLSAILKNPIYARADSGVYKYLLQHGYHVVGSAQAFDGRRGVQLYRYTGECADGGDGGTCAVVMRHDGLVPSDIWLDCQAKLSQNRARGRAVSNRTSLVGGIVFCQLCGRTMTVTRGGRRKDGVQTRYFGCMGRLREHICNGPAVPIYAESLEEAVESLICARIERLEQLIPAEPPTAEVNALKNRLCEIAVARNELVSAVLEGAADIEMLRGARERARALAEAETDVKRALAALKSKTQCGVSLVSFWKTASAERKHAAACLLIERVEVERNGDITVKWNL